MNDPEPMDQDGPDEEPSDSSAGGRGFVLLEKGVVGGSLVLFVGGAAGIVLILLPASVVLVPLGYWLWREQRLSDHRREKREALRSMMETYRIQGDPDQFEIRAADFDREHPRDRAYRKRYKLVLLREFGNCCCNCGAVQKGLDLDHFFLPKDDGGTFAMWHRNGFWVNNAIPLCQSCNRSKGARSHRAYFDEDRLIEIMDVNQRMTRRLNNEQFMGKGVPDMWTDTRAAGGNSPEKLLEKPDVSGSTFLERIFSYVKSGIVGARDLGRTTGEWLFSDGMKPACVWWLECRTRSKIAMLLVASSILFVIGLFVFGT